MTVLDGFGLLRDLVAVSSVSGDEAAASALLVERMRGLGFAQAYIDAAGNAVGEVGADVVGARRTIVLLGHIDTVPGDILVRIENDVLYGRGCVDAKAPLVAFVLAAAALDQAALVANGVRVVVIGAVEEEAATSKGARYAATQYAPDWVIIGEPSGWDSLTLGYKGRVLLDYTVRRPSRHTASDGASVAELAVDIWNRLHAYANSYNATPDGTRRAFDSFQPGLRQMNTAGDGMWDSVTTQIGIRLPLDFPYVAFKDELQTWFAAVAGVSVRDERRETYEPVAGIVQLPEVAAITTVLRWRNPDTRLEADLTLHGHEQAWRSDKNTAVVRALLDGIRTAGGRPTFKVKTGTSDMNVLAPYWRCPIVAYGPGDSSLDHTPDERISRDEFERGLTAITRAIEMLAG